MIFVGTGMILLGVASIIWANQRERGFGVDLIVTVLGGTIAVLGIGMLMAVYSIG